MTDHASSNASHMERSVVAEPHPRQLDESFEREYPGASRAATEAVLNLLATADLVVSDFERLLRHFGISEPAANVLAVLDGAGEPLEPRTIAQRLVRTSGSMSNLLNTLEKRGWVRRFAHPGDGRRALVELTPQGAELVDEILPRIHRLERELMTNLSAEECEQLVELTGRVQRRLVELDTTALGEPAARRRESGRGTTRKRKGASGS